MKRNGFLRPHLHQRTLTCLYAATMVFSTLACSLMADGNSSELTTQSRHTGDDCPIPPTFELYRYLAKVDRIVDGDTYEISIDLGFDIELVKMVRLRGADTPEVRGVDADTKARGQLATEAARSWFAAQGPVIIVRTFRNRHGRTESDSFGRLLADFYPDVGLPLSAYLIVHGHATP